MSRSSKRGKGIDRAEAMASRPRKRPVLRREEMPDGKLRLTLPRPAPAWVRWLGGRPELERTYGLDVPGREVYEMCDGKKDVAGIVRAFAEIHRISLGEAELSVTAYLRTLVSRGLIEMTVRGRNG